MVIDTNKETVRERALSKAMQVSRLALVPSLFCTKNLFFFLLLLCRVGQKQSGKESSVKDSVDKVTGE